MGNEIALYEGQKAIVQPKRMNYEICVPGGVPETLRRDVDFGVIKGTKKPSLYKSGAEKIAFAYGLMQRYTIESKVEEWGEAPLFYYLIRCDLVKLLPNGQEVIFTSGYGSGNTREKRNGLNGAYDAANSTLKMAQKRALTSAAIAVSGLSSAFTMDVEDMGFNKTVDNFKPDATEPTATITQAQRKRLFAIAKTYGMGNVELKAWLKTKFGLESTNDITNKLYESIVEELQKGETK